MKQIITNKSRGLTLTELLAVLLIISLLSTIAVPVYVARQEDARVRVAISECRQIAMAEETVAAMHGFYVPFQLLDELPPRPDNINAGDEERIDEHFNANEMHLIIPTIRAEDQINRQPTLDEGYENSGRQNPRVRQMVDNWAGPFISWQRFWYDSSDTSPYEGPTDDDYRDSDDLFRDFPLDPWGNPYRFYSPIGIIGDGNDHQGEDFDYRNPNPSFSNGELTRNDEDRFQRYAVVSYGRDGFSDLDTADLPPNHVYNDIFYEFGTDGVSRNFGKF
jgi:prepilin-type N-terminal cleavage/methylation domain-containing protein